ncbi:MAG: hypothetical protein V7632_4317 [Bradyrhizobium sp.]|jgi:hypothetical protein
MPRPHALRKANIFNDIAKRRAFTRCYPYQIR